MHKILHGEWKPCHPTSILTHIPPLTLSYPQFLTHQTLLSCTLHRPYTRLNYWSFFNKAMDCLRNGTSAAVDYIESLLFYILRMSDFCYLHPSTPARERMVIDFAKDEWEWPRGIKNKKTKRVWELEGEEEGGEEEIASIACVREREESRNEREREPRKTWEEGEEAVREEDRSNNLSPNQTLIPYCIINLKQLPWETKKKGKNINNFPDASLCSLTWMGLYQRTHQCFNVLVGCSPLLAL